MVAATIKKMQAPKPAGCRLGGVGISRGKLGIDLHASDKADHGSDGINQFGSRIE